MTAIDPATPDQAALRPPAEVMRLERMGSFFPTRLSFMRSLIRILAAEGAVVRRPMWDIDAAGYGQAVYSVDLGGHTYSLVACSTPLDPDRRTDRVIAEAWDSSYVLFDGIPTQADVDRIAASAPLQEAGRFTSSDLVLSRANKSVRLFEHVADSLAQSSQPDLAMVESIGYLMRTTAVYGNGKFGIADRDRFADRPHLSAPFRAEMLTVYLIRGFTLDLVEHVAAQRSPETAVTLDPAIRRFFGIGNATGLGMAPFLVSHPVLINNWMQARETALARVRAVASADEATRARCAELLVRIRCHLDQWNVEDERQMARIRVLRDEMHEVQTAVTDDFLAAPKPWDRLIELAASLSTEAQELIVALLIELHPELVDGLVDCMATDFEDRLDPSMTLDDLRAEVDANWAWAIDTDFTSRTETAQFWYVSEDKLEPRLGNRHEEPGAELEDALDVARCVQRLRTALGDAADGDQSLAVFLLAHPEHRFAARRVQTMARHPYSEIRDNLIGEGCLPIDMLRCKLSFFGAAKFDPKSDRWTRITLYQGAPTADELDRPDADDWWLPVLDPPAQVTAAG